VRLAVTAGKGYPPAGEDISRVSKAASHLLSSSVLARNVVAGVCWEGWEVMTGSAWIFLLLSFWR